MASALTIAAAHVQRIRRVQTIAIAWMIVEVGVSLLAAWRAHSAALLAFGGDSVIELLSAVIVFWSFRAEAAEAHTDKRVARVLAGLLFALAACVVVTSFATLAGYGEPRPTFLGIGILFAAAVVMPLLAKEKRKLSVAIGSASLRADAAQSGTCAYLSLIALVGLMVNAVWHVAWADPVAALAIVPLVAWEGREAMQGKPCRCP